MADSVARRLVLDCDTGTDDAIAIMLAALHPGLELLGVCSVFGNHPVTETTANTWQVLARIGREDVPVVRGAAAAGTSASAASDWLGELARAATERFTLVSTGPLTNLGAALRAEPSLVEAVDEVVVMAGNFGVRAAGPVERNAGNDPAAMAAVLAAGFARVALVPLDATFQALMGRPEVAALRALGTVAGGLAAGFVTERVEAYRDLPGMDHRAPVHDPLTVAHLLDPEVVRLRPARVLVEADGRTRMVEGSANAEVALSCDAARFTELLLATFAG